MLGHLNILCRGSVGPSHDKLMCRPCLGLGLRCFSCGIIPRQGQHQGLQEDGCQFFNFQIDQADCKQDEVCISFTSTSNKGELSRKLNVKPSQPATCNLKLSFITPFKLQALGENYIAKL